MYHATQGKAWRKYLMALFVISLLAFGLLTHQRLSARQGGDGVHGEKIIVLNYHKIDNMNISLSVRPEDFERQMKFLVEHNFHTITPQEMYAALVEGKKLPENPVLITLDDGYLDNYTNAYPILKKYGLKATIFVITGFMDRGQPGYFTWGQAAEMEASGLINIESHTVTHSSLTDLNEEQLRQEITASKADIERRLGKQVDFLAYPTGTYNLHIAAIVKEAGYKGAFTVHYGNVDQKSNLYALERVPIFHTEDTYRSFLERIQYVPIFERLGWTKS
ncbi:MAG: polysaccharide deacetylase family protein [Schwartzia sp. (in: firmicutes)]